MSIHVGILGPSLFGKSYAAMYLSAEYWRLYGIRSIVLDPNGEDWGPWALVFTNRAKFWAAVWKHRRCAVFVDDLGENMDRDKTASPLFTRIRHNFHLFHAIGHTWTELLPKQRNQLGKLFLFWQTRESAEAIAREWSDERILEACTLPKYQFLYCLKFGKAPHHIIERSSLPATRDAAARA